MVPSGLFSSWATPRGQLAHGREFFGVDEVAVDLADLPPRNLQLVAHPLRLLDHEGEAHGLFRQPVVDRHGLGPARVIAAGPAVQLVPRQELVGAR